MSYSLRSKGRAPISDLPEKKKTPRKSSSRRRKTNDADEDCGTDTGSEPESSFSEIEDSSSNFGVSPHVASSPLASLIERSWKSGIAELIGGKEEKKELTKEKMVEHESDEPVVEGGEKQGEDKGCEERQLTAEAPEDKKEGDGKADDDGKEDKEERKMVELESDEPVVEGGATEGEEKGSEERQLTAEALIDEKEGDSDAKGSNSDAGDGGNEEKEELTKVKLVPFESDELTTVEAPEGEKEGDSDADDDGVNGLLDIMREAADECDNEKKTANSVKTGGEANEDDAKAGEGNGNDSKGEGGSDSFRAMTEEEDEREVSTEVDRFLDEEENEKNPDELEKEVPRRDQGGEDSAEDEVNLGSKDSALGDSDKPSSDEVVTECGEEPNSPKPGEKEATMTEDILEADNDGNNLERKDNDNEDKMNEKDAEDVNEKETRDLTELMEVVAENKSPPASISKTSDAAYRDINLNKTSAAETSNEASKVPEDPFPLVADLADEESGEDEEDEDDDDDEARQLAAIFKDPEETALESIVFGDDEEIVQELGKKVKEATESKKRKRGDGADKGMLDGDDEKTSAWSDDDDYEERIDSTDPRHRKSQAGGNKKGCDVIEGAALKKKLKRDFQKVMGETPAWAIPGARRKKQGDGDDDDDDDDSTNPLLTRAGNFLNETKGAKLGFGGGILDWKKCCRANRQERGKQLRTIQFHPSAQVLMTTGLDETLRLHQIDGVHNPKIQSVAFERFPIHRSALTIDGNSVVLTSKKPWFKIYDMLTGNTTHVPAIKGKQELNKFRLTPDGRSIAFLGSHGFVYVVDLTSKEIRASVKMNGRVNDVAFIGGVPGVGGGELMLTHGDGGSVYVWDFRNTSSCVHRFVDEGCLDGTVVRASPDSRFLACASTSGILNLYAAEDALKQSTPKPAKTMQNLLTTIHDVEFNRTSELMAFAAGETANGVRLTHVPTMGVFSNYPPQDSMGKPRALAFSPYSGYFAVADSKDTVNLYRLNHYENF